MRFVCGNSQPGSGADGFTLIEVMISVGLISVALLTASSMVTDSMRAERSASLSLEFGEAMSRVGQIMNNPSSCNQVFNGQSLDLASLSTSPPVYVEPPTKEPATKDSKEQASPSDGRHKYESEQTPPYNPTVPSPHADTPTIPINSIPSSSGSVATLGQELVPGLVLTRMELNQVLHQFAPVNGKQGYMVNLRVEAAKSDSGGKPLPGVQRHQANFAVTLWVNAGAPPNTFSSCLEP